MSRFNTQATTLAPDSVNLAGGEAHSQTAERELVSILLTSFATDSFYRSADNTFAKVKELIGKCDKIFVAKAAVYARREFGMRSISHVVAAELAKHIAGSEWAKEFYNAIVFRPDDMSEIISYYFANCAKKSNNKRGRKTIPNAMKAGFALAFNKFNAYGFAKYRGEGKDIKLIDIVNMVHPLPHEKNGVVSVDMGDYIKAIPETERGIFGKYKTPTIEIPALEALMLNLLKPAETWETALTQAGQNAESEDDKANLKKDAWVTLIRTKKIKYLALLRNLRNIIEQAPEVVAEACALLTDATEIKKSLIFPFQYFTAYEQIEMLNISVARQVLKALNIAVDISCANVPKFGGETLVVLDTSGSMTSAACKYGVNNTPAKIGALFAAILVKSNDADFINFSNDASYQNLNSQDSTITLARSIKFKSGGTNFHSVFQTANKKYDRIVILSDMQGWGMSQHSNEAPHRSFNTYKNATKANPFVFSFDLSGYGSMLFPESKVCALAGFSDKVFDIMQIVEKDPKALVNTIRKYSFLPELEAPARTVVVGAKGKGKSSKK